MGSISRPLAGLTSIVGFGTWATGAIKKARKWRTFREQAKTSHVFGEPGQYQVTLQVVDRLHPSLKAPVRTFFVQAQPPVLSVKPIANPTQGYAPLTVLFAPGLSVVGYPVNLSYHWDFGDGASAAEANPVHTYKITRADFQGPGFSLANLSRAKTFQSI